MFQLIYHVRVSNGIWFDERAHEIGSSTWNSDRPRPYMNSIIVITTLKLTWCVWLADRPRWNYLLPSEVEWKPGEMSVKQSCDSQAISSVILFIRFLPSNAFTSSFIGNCVERMRNGSNDDSAIHQTAHGTFIIQSIFWFQKYDVMPSKAREVRPIADGTFATFRNKRQPQWTELELESLIFVEYIRSTWCECIEYTDRGKIPDDCIWFTWA